MTIKHNLLISNNLYAVPFRLLNTYTNRFFICNEENFYTFSIIPSHSHTLTHFHNITTIYNIFQINID